MTTLPSYPNRKSNSKNDNHGDRLPQVRRYIPGVVLLLAAFVAVYYSTFRWLLNVWSADREFSHGFLVPIVSLYLIWIRRDKIRTIVPHPSITTGTIVLMTSAFLLAAGRAGGFVLAEGISLLLFIPACVLFLGGWSYLKALALPIGYLLFMVPWMEEFLSHIHWPFQILSAKIGVWILEILGYPVFLERIYIFLPEITLKVVEACSGVRFLTAVVALGFPLVYITQRSWWTAAGVILGGVFITILVNGLRVAFVGILAFHYGPGMLHGPFHIFHGFFVAQVGFIALFLLNWRIYKYSKTTGPKLWERPVEVRQRERNHGDFVTPLRGLYALCFVSILIWGYMSYFSKPVPVELNHSLDGFPMNIGVWHGRDVNWIRGMIFSRASIPN